MWRSRVNLRTCTCCIVFFGILIYFTYQMNSIEESREFESEVKPKKSPSITSEKEIDPVSENLYINTSKEKANTGAGKSVAKVAVENLKNNTATVAKDQVNYQKSIVVTEVSKPLPDVNKIAQNTGCDCKHERLSKNILEFYNRVSWWDSKLCGEKSKRSILSNISDIIPLQTFNKDVFSHEDHKKNIFFFENNCKTTIQFYVLCSLESAANFNPNATVFLLTVVSFLEDGSRAIRKLLDSYSNIAILQADFDNILQDTPLDSFRSAKVWTDNQNYIKPHMSDITRIALVWKEGGTYMDSDIITMKRHPEEEIVLLHGANDISNGYIRAKKHHEYITTVMNYQKSSYDANSFVSVGPRATTAGIVLYCNKTTFVPGMCHDVAILPMKFFIPLNWDQAENVFAPESTINITEFLKFSYGIHTSHHILQERLNSVPKNSLYDYLTRNFCPISYKNAL